MITGQPSAARFLSCQAVMHSRGGPDGGGASREGSQSARLADLENLELDSAGRCLGHSHLADFLAHQGLSDRGLVRDPALARGGLLDADDMIRLRGVAS